MPKSYQKLSLLNGILSGTDVITLKSAEVQNCRRRKKEKKRIFNSANNHQKLALMNNLRFRTVVLAIKNAELQLCRPNTKKLNSAEKHQTLALLNSFFGTFVPRNCAEAHYCFRKTKKS